MFLNRLNEKEKKAFLQLAKYVAKIDDNVSKKEEEIIDYFCIKMQLNKNIVKENDDLYNILSNFETKTSKHIVLLELLGLIYADDFLHFKEQELWLVLRIFLSKSNAL